MFLSYLALAILILVIIVLVYVFIWIHDIPYMLAKKRNHPNLHAIHIACWLSLFTLHALWPFVVIWAIAQKPRLEVIVVDGEGEGGLVPGKKKAPDSADPETLRNTIAALERRFAALARKRPGAVPRPPHWGGYRLAPEAVEFWQSREDRLHDRLVYRLERGRWRLERLAP